MMMSTPEAVAVWAVVIELVWSHTSHPASFSIRTHSTGGGAQWNTTAGTRSSMHTLRWASVANGPKAVVSMMKLIANGRAVKARVEMINLRKISGGEAPVANWPNPPTLETAAANDCTTIKPIPAETKGNTMRKRTVSFE